MFCFFYDISLDTRAQIWNLADDFSINSNPNGQWSYGSTDTGGGDFKSTGSQGIALNAGDVIDLVVGPNGDYSGDSTGIDVTIQILPEVLSCFPNNASYYKTIKPSNSVSSNVSPNISGKPSLCAIPSSKPGTWYVKTTWDGGVTWQWVDMLSSLGLGAN